jgi:hypothetical protein
LVHKTMKWPHYRLDRVYASLMKSYWILPYCILSTSELYILLCYRKWLWHFLTY